MKQLTWLFVVLAVIGLSMPAYAANTSSIGRDGNFVKYDVSGQAIEIISAVTPYDSNQKLRDTFLEWFKRGFETVLNGRAPLMIEWQDSDAGRAGQRGYDSGMDEAERYLKEHR